MPYTQPIIGQAIHRHSQSELLLSRTAQGLTGAKLGALSEERGVAGLGFTSLSPVSPCLFCQGLSRTPLLACSGETLRGCYVLPGSQSEVPMRLEG